MTNKSNDATPQRPEGNRIINAPMVALNLTDLIAQTKREQTWQESNHNAITVFKSDTMRIVLMGLKAGAELKPHKANGVISVQVLEGKMNFITDQQTTTLQSTQMIALNENITHSVEALEETFFLLTLSLNP